MKHDVLCLPSLNVETEVRGFVPPEIRGQKVTVQNLFVEGQEYVVCLDGQTLRFAVGGYSQLPAGSSVNCAVGLSRLGLSVTIAGAVGQDSEGVLLQNELSSNGITPFMVDRDTATPHTLCVLEDDGSATLFCHKPTYTLDNAKMLELVSKIEAKFVVATGVRMAELELVEQIFKVRLTGSVCNMLTPNSELLVYRERMLGLLHSTDVLQVNEKEARILLGTQLEPELAALELLKMGPKVTLITLGDRGAAVAVFRENGNHEVLYSKPLPSKVVDTTGAGDAFTTGFLYGLFSGATHSESLRLGSWVAARNIEHIGGHSGMPTLAELKNIVTTREVA